MKRLLLLVGLLLAIATPNFAQTKTDTIQFNVRLGNSSKEDSILLYKFSDKVVNDIEIEWISHNGTDSQRFKPGENGFNPDKEGYYRQEIQDSGRIHIYYSYALGTASYIASFLPYPLYMDYTADIITRRIVTNSDYLDEGVTISALNVESCSSLMALDCSYNQLTNIDVSKNPTLIALNCSYNQLKDLDISHNSILEELSCSNNQLTTLDVNNNTALEFLYCNNNQLSSLTVYYNTKLQHLFCNYNQLSSLDASHNTALTWLECHNNQLIHLNINNCTALHELDCANNQLSSLWLDVRLNNFRLSTLDCSNNNIPLSMLYKTYIQRNNWFEFEADPQTDTILIQRQQLWDLSSERALGENISTFEITDATGQTLSSGAWEEKDFTFRFHKSGLYKLTLQNRFDSETDEAVTFTWYISVVDEIPEGFYTVLVATENAEWGTVTGNGTYQEGKEVTITAWPQKGYRFINWTKKDGSVFSTDSVYTFAVTEILELTAHFEKLPDEIPDDVANESFETDNLRIYAQDRMIYLSENRGLVQVFNTLGQCVYSGTATAIPVRTGGLYIVKVGTHRHKVLVR